MSNTTALQQTIEFQEKHAILRKKRLKADKASRKITRQKGATKRPTV